MNLSEIVVNVKEAQDLYLSSTIDSKEIIDKVFETLNNNFDLLDNAYKLDKNKQLSSEKFKLQFDIKPLPQNDAFKNEYGKIGNLIVPYGVLGVISNCDIYNILRIIILAIQTKNGLIINITDNVGTNFLMIENIKRVLEGYNLQNLIEIYNNKSGESLEENEDIDGLIYIGKKVNLERLKVVSTKPLIYSGCGSYELYIENNLDEKIIETEKNNENIKIYSREEIGIGQNVSGLDEAIARIEENGNGYAVSIITESRENAKAFVNKIKARNIFVNALPTLIDDQLDIEAEDLTYKKSVLVYE